MRPHVSCHCSCLPHPGGTLYSHCTLWVFRAETPVEGLAGGGRRAASSPPGPQAGCVLSLGGPVQDCRVCTLGLPWECVQEHGPSAETLASCHHCHHLQAWDLGQVALKGVWARSVKVSVGWLSGHQKVSGNSDKVLCHSQLAR